MRLYNQLLLTRMPNLWLSGNKKELPIPAFNVQLQMSLAHCCKAECLRYTTSSSASTMINALGRYGRTKKSNKTHLERWHCSKNRTIAPSLRHHCAIWHHTRPSWASPEVELTRHGPTGMSVRTLNCYGLRGQLLKGSMEEVRHFNSRTERETPASIHLRVSNSVLRPHASQEARLSYWELPLSPVYTTSCQLRTRRLLLLKNSTSYWLTLE